VVGSLEGEGQGEGEPVEGSSVVNDGSAADVDAGMLSYDGEPNVTWRCRVHRFCRGCSLFAHSINVVWLVTLCARAA
jgi:hypothetical protein